MVARILLPITLVCLLWGAPLRADPSALTTIEAAEAAASAVDRWCTGMSAERTTEAATALREVGAVWVRVSRSHDLSDDPLLLYWRGRLSACLNQDERAISDLQGFLDVAGDDNAVASLAREARRMLLRLGVSTRTRRRQGSSHPSPPPGSPQAWERRGWPSTWGPGPRAGCRPPPTAAGPPPWTGDPTNPSRPRTALASP